MADGIAGRRRPRLYAGDAAHADARRIAAGCLAAGGRRSIERWDERARRRSGGDRRPGTPRLGFVPAAPGRLRRATRPESWRYARDHRARNRPVFDARQPVCDPPRAVGRAVVLWTRALAAVRPAARPASRPADPDARRAARRSRILDSGGGSARRTERSVAGGGPGGSRRGARPQSGHPSLSRHRAHADLLAAAIDLRCDVCGRAMDRRRNLPRSPRCCADDHGCARPGVLPAPRNDSSALGPSCSLVHPRRWAPFPAVRPGRSRLGLLRDVRRLPQGHERLRVVFDHLDAKHLRPDRPPFGARASSATSSWRKWPR